MKEGLETTLKDCDVISNDQLADDRHIWIALQSTEGNLTEQQFTDYHERIANFLSYLLQV